jgi:hypothetical protein
MDSRLSGTFAIDLGHFLDKVNFSGIKRDFISLEYVIEPDFGYLTAFRIAARVMLHANTFPGLKTQGFTPCYRKGSLLRMSDSSIMGF